ncbi:MAG: hypothetical protein ACK5IQ_00105 [Bacteroidales bacterium]
MRRLKSKGCLAYVLIGAIILVINIFTFLSWWMMIDAIGDIYEQKSLASSSVGKLAGVSIFGLIFAFLFVGIIMYSFGFKMTGIKNLASKAAFYVIIPFTMIGLDALLIYGLFYGEPVPTGARLLLIFFIIMLTLGTAGYLKKLFSQGSPTMKKTRYGEWSGGWKEPVKVKDPMSSDGRNDGKHGN